MIFYTGLAITTVGAVGIIQKIKYKFEAPIILDTELLIGYDRQGWVNWPVVINMEITPHLFVCGLSGSGKTCMVETAIRDKQVVLINAFKKDFKTVKALRINGNKNILRYFKSLLDKPYYRQIPLYIVIDELVVLCLDKEVTRAIMDLLAVGRHYNIYIIGISQIGTKETVKFKDLFNSRVCFRQVEESSYRAVLGYSPETRDLQKRQFLYYSDSLGKGYTYDVS